MLSDLLPPLTTATTTTTLIQLLHLELQLVDPGNRKPLPAQLEIRIRLQKPLTKVHVVKTTDERWLTVHFGGVGAPPPAASSVSPAAPATVASPPQNVGVANNHGSLAKPSVSLTGKPPSAAVSVENTPTANAADLEAMETEFEKCVQREGVSKKQYSYPSHSTTLF